MLRSTLHIRALYSIVIKTYILLVLRDPPYKNISKEQCICYRPYTLSQINPDNAALNTATPHIRAPYRTLRKHILLVIAEHIIRKCSRNSIYATRHMLCDSNILTTPPGSWFRDHNDSIAGRHHHSTIAICVGRRSRHIHII